MIAFLLDNKILVILLIALVLLGASVLYARHLRSNIETLELQKAALESSLEISNTNIKSLLVSINAQNAAIEQIKTAADQRTMRFLDEIAAARVVSKHYKKQAADILSRTAPQNISKCDSANRLIIEEIQNAK